MHVTVVLGNKYKQNGYSDNIIKIASQSLLQPVPNVPSGFESDKVFQLWQEPDMVDSAILPSLLEQF